MVTFLVSLQAAASPVAKEGLVQRAKEGVQDAWYTVRAACSGLAGKLQHWLAVAWHWLQHLWEQAVHAWHVAVRWVRQRLPRNLKDSAATSP